MLVITVLGIACYVVIKRVVPRLARPAGRNVRVLETACLDRDKRIHVLGVGTEKFLVASGRGGVTMLADVTRALAGEERASREERSPAETPGRKASGS